MHFRILKEITDVETIATGSGIREIARFASVTGAAGGGNAKASQKLSFLTVSSPLRSYTGTRRPVSDVANSRSSASSEVMHYG